MTTNPHYNRELCAAALEEFGFSLVPVGEIGAPSPGRIADQLSDIYHALDDALKAADLDGAREVSAQLRRLLLALDAYDGGMMNGGKLA